MKLFKAIHSDVWSNDDVLVFWEEDKLNAMKHVREANLKDTVEYLTDDMTINEILEEMLGTSRERVLQFIGNDDFENLARLHWLLNDSKEWSIEEVEVPSGHDVYVAYPEDICEADDVEIVFIDPCLVYSDSDIKNEVYNELAYRESKEMSFREYVVDPCINMSFAEKFWHDDKGYFFTFDLPVRVRDDLEGVNIDELFIDNIKTYFSNQPEMGEAYIKYIKSGGAEPKLLTSRFFFYVAKRLLEEGSWNDYSIRKVERGVGMI